MIERSVISVRCIICEVEKERGFLTIEGHALDDKIV